jgi:hypothetical protein
MDIQQKTKHWQRIFEKQRSSGLNIIGFCRNNKINLSPFYSWRKRISTKTLTVNWQQMIPFVIQEHPLTQSTII